MFDRITHPEKFIDAERVGLDWIKDQKEEYKGLAEAVRSFFSLKSMTHDPVANFFIKLSGVAGTELLVYTQKVAENSSHPYFTGGTLITLGIGGILAAGAGTLDSMHRRKIERERKTKKAAA